MPDLPALVARGKTVLGPEARSTDRTDGLSLDFGDWRMNLRASNTEPLLRLNVEARGDAGLVAEGVQPGDRIGLMCKTSFEWSLIDFALSNALNSGIRRLAVSYTHLRAHETVLDIVCRLLLEKKKKTKQKKKNRTKHISNQADQRTQ